MIDFLGTKITFEGEGDEGDQNSIAGDIVFIIRDKAHGVFERSNSDLIFRVRLTLKQALLGTTIAIPFLDSTKNPYQLRTQQEILTPQTEKRFPNEGLPYPKEPTRRGDLVVRFDILFPKLLNSEQRTLVDCCLTNSIDAYQPHNSLLHTMVIENNQNNSTNQTNNPNLNGTRPSSSNQKPSHHHVNSNGHPKPPSSPTKSKDTTARATETMSSPSSSTTKSNNKNSATNETVFN